MTDLSPQQLAARWGLSVQTLKGWRAAGHGPPWTIRPRLHLPRGAARISYSLHDILAYEAAHNITPNP